ncbi:MAG: alpha/beta fold hydrolase [Anaerolineales bacterium]|jgi:pimeloyl-ACP methyl ester carboxylesterase
MNHKVKHTDLVKTAANGIEIVYDTFGDSSAAPMLLVMGLGAQLIAWDEEFCEKLAASGYWVIRFDNRDVGLSTHFDEAGIPDVMAMIQAQMQGEALDSPYRLKDLADDAVGLLDAIGVQSAHVVGVSMGGMIVQEMAIHHAQRIRTMTSIMSSTGNPALPSPKPEAIGVLMKPPAANREAHIESSVEASKILGGSALAFDEDRVREKAGQSYDRGLSPAGTARQLAAILASGSRKEALKSVKVPTLVIHGDIDPLVPVEGGIDTAQAIPGAQLLIIEGMGHDLPPVIWPQVIEAIIKHAV